MHYSIFIGLISLIFYSTIDENEDTARSSKYKMVWSDEFDQGTRPDPRKWNYETGYIRNKELQYYTEDRSENARIENGMLVIETRNDNYEGNPITSASLHTSGLQDFKYGRIEVRAKLPTGKGMWPAIWMLGNNKKEVGWPACGEIDIMENVGFDPDVIHANVHTKAYNHVKGTNKGDKIIVSSPSENFHVYAIEWDKEKIEFFVDKKKYFMFENEGGGTEVWPFSQPHNLKINAAFGGGWGGQQGVDQSILPQKFYVDYVRYYQKK